MRFIKGWALAALIASAVPVSAQDAKKMFAGAEQAGIPVTLGDGSVVFMPMVTCADLTGTYTGCAGSGGSSTVAQSSTTSGQSGGLIQGAVTTSAPSYTTGKTNPLSLTPAGGLRVDASATTQPVSIASVTPDTNGNLPVANRASIFYNGATGTGSALTGSATFTGTARDSGYAASTYHQFGYFSSFFLADQAGTASIECSNDNSTWYTCATSAMVAATPLILQVPVLTRYHRSKVVNGSSAETYLWVNSGYTGG